MARATRSSTQLDKFQSPPRPTKKRKRTSDHAQLFPQKQPRSHNANNDAADAAIDGDHAQKILDILEMTDSQGLLDRVFPVPEDANSLSLRTLLEQCDQHPLKVLRSAVQHLFPISSLHRTTPSTTAAQQLRFCNLAISLLQQASLYAVPIPLSLSSILPPHDKVPHSPTLSKRKYALLQRLPTGDYWTSLDSSDPALTTTTLKDLPTANAELVAILPTSLETPSKSVPTLGSYKPSKLPAPAKPIPPQRRVNTCNFLDYGLWASFAPAFDHDAQEVGPRELGQVVFGREERRKSRIALCTEETIIDEVLPPVSASQDPDAELEELFPPDDVTNIKAALGSLQLENAVQELLERNRRALIRLEELQRSRLMADGGGSSTAEEGSEEWDTAQGILDSFAVLASLRPRAVPLDPALQDDKTPPKSIMPPPSVLHKLHRTLAIEPSTGWYGTLPATRTTALRDDNTIKVRSGVTLPTATTTTTTTTTAITATPVPATTTSMAMGTTPYAGFTYAYGSGTPQPSSAQQPQQAYRPSTGTPAPGTATSPYVSYKPPYYPPYAGGTQQGGIQPNYYGQQQQGYSTAAYSGWYTPYPGGVNLAANMTASTLVAGGTGGGSGSAGRGTPQPVQTGNTNPATTYGAFFSGTPTPPAVALKTPAVANTVSYAAPQGAVAGGAPTLPIHLRSGQQLQQPLQQGSYFGAYQPPVAR